MKKTIIQFVMSGVFAALVTGASPGFCQNLAFAQGEPPQSTSAQQPAAKDLKEVLDQLKTLYGKDILFEIKTVEGLKVQPDVVKKADGFEKNLERVLKSAGLRFKKMNESSYLILSKSEVEKATKTARFQARQNRNSPLGNPVSREIGDLVNPLTARAQTAPAERTITGRVRDEKGEGLPGVSVVVQGGARGTTTNTEGRFSLSVPDRDVTLSFSYVGYLPQEVTISNQSNLDITLLTDVKALEEVVVVGYGAVKKSDLTGSVASVNEQELTAYPAVSAVQALQGRAAGVSVQSTNGEPGGDFKIRIRGATSINASSAPLFVVDGLVGGVVPPPEDIASIEVLKDASATAIYGSRGANGVVMVTTKSGKAGKVQVSVNSSYSRQREINRLNLLSARPFAEYINEARGRDYYDLNNLEADTDWQSLIYRPGYTQNHQVSVAGGKEGVKYYVSGVFYDQQGVIHTSKYNRMSLTTNLAFDVSKCISLSLNSLMSRTKQDGVYSQRTSAAADPGVTTAAYRFEPAVGVFDADGNYNVSKIYAAPSDNPLAVLRGREIENIGENLQTNLRATVKILNGLTFNSTVGFIFRNARNGSYNNRISNRGQDNGGIASLSNRRNFNILNENYLNYDKTFAQKHHLTLTGGYSYQKFRNESFGASNAGFISDAFSFWNLDAGTVLKTPNSGLSESEIASFYGRVNYNFADRYLLTGTARYDGASQFSAGNKWSFFPSGAFAWNVSNEDFFPKNRVLSNAKLRISYGLTGNQAIVPYESLARLSNSFFVVNNAIINSVRPTAIANKDLTWETTAQFDVGLDLAFLQNRIDLSADYYVKNTSDLLFRVPIPAFSGYSSRLENIGEVQNKGVEFMISSKNLVGTLKWSSSFNITRNRSRVVSLPGGTDIIYAGAPSNIINSALQHAILREEAPVGSFYGYVYEGVYQQGDNFLPGGGFEQVAGGEKFADLNGDGRLSAEDRQIIGDPNPRYTWGLNNDFSYKGFSLNVFFQASVGGDILNLTRLELDRLNGTTNATTDALRRWTPTNTDTDIPKATDNRNSRISTRFVEDGSYVRLKNLTVGYDFALGLLSKLGIQKARLYVSAQNILTFTKYKGVDPEVAFNSDGTASGNINLGLDYGSYPNIKSVTFGVNLGL
ncbi:SusC/RagA family TonB-linked outer membrane protein [Persicitalea jodogahamensis]|uniref:SusC/RagA family TonB-linked outer membrane protein n=1 Tax=Persicitalea jodogahamensis TaxID=402147 RepID=A0A8J3DFN4_9BACT|nr:TonB-dependent receptor [Persicitalea jodogahamensis]GHB87030.1 SusC/RagA family TonB-linked outer membrane protein [Persicitalea jodogahamensis]